jgi:hypothetical protein
MMPANNTPPVFQPGQFFLKLLAHPDSPTARYTGLYLRQHSITNNAVLVTPTSPVYLRAILGPGGAGIQFMSWAHGDRKWGLVLREVGGGKAMWEKVEITENDANNSLHFAVAADGTEVLEGNKELGWRGWVVSYWSLDHPQLFWLTEAWKGELPEFCERVQIVRELPLSSTA